MPARFPEAMPWGEAWRHVKTLALDTSSQLGASLAGWERPASREELALLDLYDLTNFGLPRKKNAPRPKQLPRPWPSGEKKKTKPDVRLTQGEIIAALRAAGHTAPLPAGMKEA